MTDDSMSKLVIELYEVHGRSYKPATVHHWVQRLKPLNHAVIENVLNAAKDERVMPALSDVVNLVWAQRGESQRPLNAKEHEPTPAEKRRADHSAIMSMLWLRYNHGHYALGNFIMERCFGEIFPDPEKALAAAAESYPPEVVNRWMEERAK